MSPEKPNTLEPNPDGSAVRRFTDPQYEPKADSLAQLRSGIDALDRQIIGLLAQRAMLVKDAARFKANSFQVAAPARQAEVFAKARLLANAANCGFEGFEDVVETTYRAMVAAFIAQEQKYFDKPTPLAVLDEQACAATPSKDKK